MYIDDSWLFDLLHYYIYQCLSLVLWSTEVLKESLPLLFGIPFSIVIFFNIVIFIMWTFSAGWMDQVLKQWQKP